MFVNEIEMEIRGEKKTLNDINCRRTNTSIKFQVLDAQNSGKAKQRITLAEEKIFILARHSLCAFLILKNAQGERCIERFAV